MPILVRALTIPSSPSFFGIGVPSCILEYIKYKEYIVAQGGYIVDEIGLIQDFCSDIPDGVIEYWRYKEYIISQGGYIVDEIGLMSEFSPETPVGDLSRFQGLWDYINE